MTQKPRSTDERLQLFEAAAAWNRDHQFIHVEVDTDEFQEMSNPYLALEHYDRATGASYFVTDVFRSPDGKQQFANPYDYYPGEALDTFAEQIFWQLPMLQGAAIRTAVVEALLAHDFEDWDIGLPLRGRGKFTRAEVIVSLLRDPAWINIEKTVHDVMQYEKFEPLAFLEKPGTPSWPILTRLGGAQLILKPKRRK